MRRFSEPDKTYRLIIVFEFSNKGNIRTDTSKQKFFIYKRTEPGMNLKLLIKKEYQELVEKRTITTCSKLLRGRYCQRLETTKNYRSGSGDLPTNWNLPHRTAALTGMGEGSPQTSVEVWSKIDIDKAKSSAFGCKKIMR